MNLITNSIDAMKDLGRPCELAIKSQRAEHVFKLYQGGKRPRCLARWEYEFGATTHDPTPSPSPQEGGESTEFAALYRIEF
jgi:hypothetical protein